MKIIFRLLLIFATPLTAFAQLNCAVVAPIPPTATDKILQTEAALDTFKGILRVPPISAKAGVNVSIVHRDVLAKFPNADILALRQQELSYVCQLLNQDTSLSLTRKISIFQKIGEGIIIADDTKKPKASGKGSDGKVSSSAQPTNQQFQFGSGSIAQNGNNNTAVINNPPVDPYDVVVTYRVNGMRDEVDRSAGRNIYDSTLTIQYFDPILDAQKRGDWITVLTMSKEAISKAPEWFTPYFFLGAANLSLCHRGEGIDSLKVFLGKASGARQYSDLVNNAENDLAVAREPTYIARCPN